MSIERTNQSDLKHSMTKIENEHSSFNPNQRLEVNRESELKGEESALHEKTPLNQHDKQELLLIISAGKKRRLFIKD